MAITPLPGWHVNAAGNGVEQDAPTAPAPAPASTYSGEQTAAQRAAAYKDAGLSDPGVTATNGGALKEEGKTGADILNAINTPPLDTSFYDKNIADLTAQQAEAERVINEQFNNAKIGTENAQRSEVGSTSAALARAGGYLGNSASGQGVLLSLAQTHRAELQSLDSKRAAALNEAKSAYTEKQFQNARDKYKEVKDYEKTITERKIKYFETVQAEQEKIRKAQAERQINVDIFDAISNGAKNESEVYAKLGGRATPEQIGEYYAKIKPKTVAGDAFKLSNTDMSMLLGSGMGQDDIQALSDYVNLNGFTDELKSKLTPYQRRVMDSIFTLKKEAVEKPEGTLDALDIVRYRELYSDLQIEAGDTKSSVEAKVAASNSPEALLTKMILGLQAGVTDEKGRVTTLPASYQDTISAIKSGKGLTEEEKTKGIKIANELYGMNENGLPKSTIRATVPSDYSGAPQQSAIEQINNFLFGGK